MLLTPNKTYCHHKINTCSNDDILTDMRETCHSKLFLQSAVSSDSLAVRVADIVEQRTTRLEHPREVLVECGAIHIRGFAQGARRWVVNDCGEFAIREALHQLRCKSSDGRKYRG